MSINLEVKGNLARLLATENVIIEHDVVQTAKFDVRDRVLTLPVWDKASSVVYDLLVSHEVGHALFTPDEDFGSVPFQFINVVEDARVEKLIKRKYMGLAKTFYRGYEELNDQDFFELEDKDINTFNLADRANLFFKVGNYITLDFTVKEQEIIDMIGKCETFEDVKKAAFVLYQYCKEQKVEESSQNEVNSEDSESDSQPSNPSNESGDQSDESYKEPSTEDDDELKVETDESFQDNVKELTNLEESPYQSTYAEIPEVDLDAVIASNSQIHTELGDHFKLYSDNNNDKKIFNIDSFEKSDGLYNEFKKSAQKEVNYLVKEFECKKAADSYTRSRVDKTGVLDTTKIHNYRFSEDIFKKVNIVPDGKNHGLIFILDWSGSMSGILEDTIKQLYNLIWFCNKVHIPFEVYAFTNNYSRVTYEENGTPIIPPPRMKKEEKRLVVNCDFSLLNILTSKVNKRELDVQMLNLWRLALYAGHGINLLYTIPPQFNLGGTPLNEALVCLHQIIPQFKKENGIQKVQCVILTDGEANPLPCYMKYHTSSGYETIGPRHLSRVGVRASYLRNRKTGYVYPLPYSYYEFTDVLLKDLKQTYPDVNLIGIRLASPRDFVSFIRMYEYISDKDMSKAKKEKSYSIKESGYDRYFAMISSALFNDVEFEIEGEATKTKIRTAFAKSLKSKSLNKKVLSQFMDLVC